MADEVLPFRPKVVAAAAPEAKTEAIREGSPEHLLADWLKHAGKYTDIVICAYTVEGDLVTDCTTMAHAERYVMLAQAANENLWCDPEEQR